jgi:hypothetical protein
VNVIRTLVLCSVKVRLHKGLTAVKKLTTETSIFFGKRYVALKRAVL